jgi:RND family efflux transporter MFP subunit
MKLNRNNVIVTLLSVGSIFGVLAFNASQMPAPKKQNNSTEHATPKLETAAAVILPQVGVVLALPQPYQAEVVGFGAAKSRYQLTFTSEVSGRVIQLSQQFESGQVIKQGDELAQINDVSYQQALTLAQANVAQAELDLLEEQRQGEQAKSEWLRSGVTGEPASPLVLRTPQLAQITAALANARLALKKAQQDVNYTHVKAPFDALVVSRDIQPGSYVQAGTQLATLYSVAEVEVNVPLSEQQWQNLPELTNAQLDIATPAVTLQSSDGRYRWQGYVERVEQHVTELSRQRSLVVVVDDPLAQSTRLFPGTFVKVIIQGKSVQNLWQLPSSAISQQGDIWFVDDAGLLTKALATVLFEQNSFVYVQPISHSLNSQTHNSPTQVVKRPLSSFKVGTKVMAKVEG